MNLVSNTRSIIPLFILATLLVLPDVAWAGITYQPLVGIPGVDNAASNFNQYINQLYFVSISIAALLAVIKIIIGGVKWMLTDVVTQKSDAKNDIRSALLGLLLIIAAVLILGTINPQLTNLSVLQDAPGINLNRANNEQYGPPAPTNLGAAETVAPITETPVSGGTSQFSMTFNPAEQAIRTQPVTVNGVTTQVPVISMATLERYEFQQRELRGQCGTRGVTESGTQTVILQNERLGGRTEQRTVSTSATCR